MEKKLEKEELIKDRKKRRSKKKEKKEGRRTERKGWKQKLKKDNPLATHHDTGEKCWKSI